MPRKLAKIPGKNHLRFQIVGIRNHAKTRVSVGLQLSDIKIYRTDVITFDKLEPAPIRKRRGPAL
jgi:hypothetical protein